MFKKFFAMSKRDKIAFLREVLIIITILFMFLAILGFNEVLSIVFYGMVVLFYGIVLVLDVVLKEHNNIRRDTIWLILWFLILLLNIF